MRPSSVTAALYVTNGRPREIHVRYASFCTRARNATSPSASSTSTPAARKRSIPSTSGLGSSAATTTRAIPAATIAFTHGGVRPCVEHGSSVE